MNREQKEIADIYFHIGNGGISFSVLQRERSGSSDPALDSKSPVLQVSAHHMGQQTNNMEFTVRPEGLKALGEMLIEASGLVVFEGESQVVVDNPRKVTFGNEVRELGLPEEIRCSPTSAAN